MGKGEKLDENVIKSTLFWFVEMILALKQCEHSLRYLDMNVLLNIEVEPILSFRLAKR